MLGPSLRMKKKIRVAPPPPPPPPGPHYTDCITTLRTRGCPDDGWAGRQTDGQVNWCPVAVSNSMQIYVRNQTSRPASRQASPKIFYSILLTEKGRELILDKFKKKHTQRYNHRSLTLICFLYLYILYVVEERTVTPLLHKLFLGELHRYYSGYNLVHIPFE